MIGLFTFLLGVNAYVAITTNNFFSTLAVGVCVVVLLNECSNPEDDNNEI